MTSALLKVGSEVIIPVLGYRSLHVISYEASVRRLMRLWRMSLHGPFEEGRRFE